MQHTIHCMENLTSVIVRLKKNVAKLMFTWSCSKKNPNRESWGHRISGGIKETACRYSRV